jgi:hypothetical protein
VVHWRRGQIMQNIPSSSLPLYVLRVESLEELLAEGLARESKLIETPPNHFNQIENMTMSHPIDITHSMRRRSSATMPFYSAPQFKNSHTFHFVNSDPKVPKAPENKELVHIADIGENGGKQFVVSKFKFK